MVTTVQILEACLHSGAPCRPKSKKSAQLGTVQSQRVINGGVSLVHHSNGGTLPVSVLMGRGLDLEGGGRA